MALPGQGPPKGARALCPDQGYQYAVAVYHYARTLALAAKAVGLRAAGQTGAVYNAYVEGAVMALERLQVCLLKVPSFRVILQAKLGVDLSIPCLLTFIRQPLSGRLPDCALHVRQWNFMMHM